MFKLIAFTTLSACIFIACVRGEQVRRFARSATRPFRSGEGNQVVRHSQRTVTSEEKNFRASIEDLTERINARNRNSDAIILNLRHQVEMLSDDQTQLRDEVDLIREDLKRTLSRARLAHVGKKSDIAKSNSKAVVMRGTRKGKS